MRRRDYESLVDFSCQKSNVKNINNLILSNAREIKPHKFVKYIYHMFDNFENLPILGQIKILLDLNVRGSILETTEKREQSGQKQKNKEEKYTFYAEYRAYMLQYFPLDAIKIIFKELYTKNNDLVRKVFNIKVE